MEETSLFPAPPWDPQLPPPKSTVLGSCWDPARSRLLENTFTHWAGASGRDETPARGKVLCRVVGALVQLGLLKSLSEGLELTPTPQISPVRRQVLPQMLRIW